MDPDEKTRGRIGGGMLAFIGFLLSPLSWWNDAFVNIPVAYAAALLLSLADERLFVASFIGAYWATNVLGLALMHAGASRAAGRETRGSLLQFIAISLAYTALILLLARMDFVRAPLAHLGATGR
jgi:hypothetical protein